MTQTIEVPALAKARALNDAMWRCLPADEIEGTPLEEASVEFRKAADTPLTDEECLALAMQLVEDRVTINTGLLKDEETGNVTHQVVRLECGDFVTVSQPQQLETVLRIATPEETGETVQ